MISNDDVKDLLQEEIEPITARQLWKIAGVCLAVLVVAGVLGYASGKSDLVDTSIGAVREIPHG